MLKILYISLLFLSMIRSSLAVEPYLRFDSYNYSEPTSINSFLNEFNGSFEGGTQAFAHEWLEAGARIGNWEIGLLTRYDYDLSFSEDLAELYYLTNNKLPLDAGRTFQLDLSAKHYRTHGLRLGRYFKIAESLSISLGLAYLQGLKLTDGHLTGEAAALSNNDYDFTVHTDYYYSEDPLFDRVVEEPSGWGYSIDLIADWNPLPKLGLHLQVKDILGEIYWRQAPHTIADANSDNKTFDEDGYVEFVPTLKGIEEYRDFTQTLHAFGSFSADYQLTPRYSLLYNGDFTAETYFSGLGASYSFKSDQKLSMLFYPETQALEFNHKGPFWNIRLVSDAFTLKRSNLLRISGHLSYEF